MHNTYGIQSGEHVFLKVKEKRSWLRLGSCRKLAVRYCGPFVYKCARFHFGSWSSWSHNLENSFPTYDGSLERKWDNLRDCGAKKGVHSLGCAG
jgi:hypothetical protein